MVAPTVLREYAVLADGERGAIIGPWGDITWMCFPSWDSPAILSSLHGGPGHYLVRPEGRWWVWGGQYEDTGLIWRSRWVTGSAVVECREALARPAGPGRMVVLRSLRAVRGSARIEVALDVRAEYGTRRMTGLRRDDDGIWHARSGNTRIRWLGGARAVPRSGRLAMSLHLAEGDAHDLVLEISTDDHGGDLDPQRLWGATEAAWRDLIPGCEDTLAPRDTRLAYAVMAGLTSGTGTMVAAATTSLPESRSGGRCYDYRYCWIRDQCFAGLAVAAHGGLPGLLDAHVGFITERLLADGDRMMPAYRTSGEPVPDEQPAALDGYPGADVVTGNHVNRQFQLDAFGEALQLLAAAARADRLPPEGAKAARIAADAIAARWKQPDAGIWETSDHFWTHSRLACVGGLRTAAAAGLGPKAGMATWLALADAITAETTRRCLSPRGHWQRAEGDYRLDASLLLPSVRGALPPGDPRSVATLQAVRRELADDGFVYRYKVADQPLGEVEGAFMACGFFLVLAEAEHGEQEQAMRRFERLRSCTGTPGLFTEEYDIGERQLRGNLPQAFTHALLLQCATVLYQAQQSAAGGA